MPQFKPSKSMPVSRVECQSEWLSIRDVTVASWEGEDCLLSSFIRVKAASAPPPLLQGLSVSLEQSAGD